MNKKIKRIHIAPCGMDCAICLGFQRSENKCPGCNKRNKGKAKEDIRCTIVKCARKKKITEYCYKCGKFPCARMNSLDKRYRTKHGMSMIENLTFIKENGINEFVKNEDERWRCRKCGGLICVHRGRCIRCNNEYENK